MIYSTLFHFNYPGPNSDGNGTQEMNKNRTKKDEEDEEIPETDLLLACKRTLDFFGLQTNKKKFLLRTKLFLILIIN